MTEKTAVQQGFFWHVNHTIFLEWCYDYEERAQYIRTNKPQNEQEIRLRLFKPVQGRLPEAVVKARQVYDEARPAFDKAYQAYNEAYQAYDKALIDNTAKIEALHANECPNCPWNGHTIFPNS